LLAEQRLLVWERRLARNDIYVISGCHFHCNFSQWGVPKPHRLESYALLFVGIENVGFGLPLAIFLLLPDNHIVSRYGHGSAFVIVEFEFKSPNVIGQILGGSHLDARGGKVQ